MMRYVAGILRQTARNLRQAWGTQLMSLLTVGLSVLLFAFFFLIYTNMLKAGQRFGDEIRLIVYLDEEIAPELRPQIEKKVRDFGEVEKLVFVSRSEAFAQLKQRLGSEQDVLAELDPAFLPPSIEVYPLKSLRSLSKIEQFSRYLHTLPGVSKVQYGREWLTRLSQFTSLLQVIVVLTGGLLVFTMVFIVSYTIRLTVDTRREEIEILQLLGASRAYFRLPLLLEGILQGLLGSALGIAGLVLLYRLASDSLGLAGVLKLFGFSFFQPVELGAILLAGTLLCTAGSLFSIRRISQLWPS